MSIIDSGGVLVGAPACRPARYGLLSVADIDDRSDLEGHWLAGVSADIDSCEDLLVHTACPPGGPMPNKAADATSFDTHNGDPFFLVGGYKCSPVGASQEKAQEILRRRMERGESRSLEHAFWTGLDAGGNAIRENLGNNPDAVDLTPGTGAVTVADGVAMLESWAGTHYPCEPIVHSARGVATYMAQNNLLLPDGQAMRMVGTGTAVAIGGGYDVTGPMSAAAPAGEAWIFVTGGVKVLRGQVSYLGVGADGVDRRVNDIVMFAERPYAILLDCLVAAVRVTLKSCCC